MSVKATFSVEGNDRRAVIKIPHQETLVLLSGESRTVMLEDSSDTRIDVVETPTLASAADVAAEQERMRGPSERAERIDVSDDDEIFDADLDGADDEVSRKAVPASPAPGFSPAAPTMAVKPTPPPRSSPVKK